MSIPPSLRLPLYAGTTKGDQVLKVFGSEFARSCDIMQAYNAAVQVSQNNGSYLEFLMALWSDIFVLSSQLARLDLQLWRSSSRSKEISNK